ncbi:BapA/Bap/LapF family prefix-like domain-containing protein [Acinetobacter sp. TY1]|uniref:BapA/Bap/LapF family prefix-like domain-containing protein n=1 Tax=Acinetobacter sp. TY1 TaxID=3387626 RepID=UPI003AF7A00A
MQKIIVIDKATMEKVEIDSNIIKLEKGSIIQTKILREDVAEIIQDGNNLIIKMKDGEILTIENYFVVDAEGNNTALVFEGTECAFLLLDWQNGVAGFKELAGLEELLPIAVGGGSTASNLLPWIVGGALVGGTVIAADGSNGSSKDQPKVPEVPIAPVVTINPVVPDKDGTTTITGTVNNPNADVIVTLDGKEYKAKVDPTPNADGTYNWTVDVPTSALPPQGAEVPVKGAITDPNTGLVSPPGTDEAPVILPPKAPVVTIDQVVPDKDGTTTITGTVDNPNADVTITIGGKEYPVNVDPTPNEDGTYNWTIDVPTNKLPPIGQEIPVKATVTDPNTGLISEPGQDEAPVVVPPKAPYVTIDPIVPSEDDTTTITGTVDDPNADVTVTVGGKEYPVKVDPTPNDDGTYNWIVDVSTAELPPVG